MDTLQVQPRSFQQATPLLVLAPLELDSVSSIYLDQSNEAIQVSLRLPDNEPDPAALVELYTRVQDQVTDLIAFVLHLITTGEAVPPVLRFDHPEQGYALLCVKKAPSKALSRWRWERDGVEVGQAECKCRFEFGRAGSGAGI